MFSGRRTRYYSNNVVLDASGNKGKFCLNIIFLLCDIDIYERDHKSTFLMHPIVTFSPRWALLRLWLAAMFGSLLRAYSRELVMATFSPSARIIQRWRARPRFRHDSYRSTVPAVSLKSN